MKYLAFHQDKEYYYVVTEKLELELHLLLRRRRFFLPEQTRQLVRPILSAIDYLHDMDVCHRDVKLENCLLKNADDLSSVKVGGLGEGRGATATTATMAMAATTTATTTRPTATTITTATTAATAAATNKQPPPKRAPTAAL